MAGAIMSDEAIATVVGFLIGAFATLLGVIATIAIQRVVLRQKARELHLTSLDHLGGGSQERNLGISALEFYWKDYASEKQLIIPVLVGAAIYLLTESKQGDAQHERYNLKRIMRLLLYTSEIEPSSSDVASMVDCFCDLHKALCDWDQKMKSDRGLKVEKELLDRSKTDLEELFPTLKCGTV
jgi:hypothetical protein